ncbi:uncharacterized protein LOC112089909 [Eutrema salsugineum]|uniref:uncharacterized protein LOC112089909 n=1 Tax=Eutrema salsugineum TaxID=72664 RepID=UPI000CED1AC3|nr:uncharacterized protein LOC112089909 [Eutrema salsugineum]
MANIDKALRALSLEEEEDTPFIMPKDPKYCSSERNIMSIMGRTLNPECQNMADLILDMPRKWQVYDRVRGMTLTKEKFQFIFKYEHDLEEVKEIAFDPYKPQSNDYVRAEVNFDVSKPVRRSKAVVLPNGETTTVWYDFERIQKRCYHCQRLTHEKDKCSILIKSRIDKAAARRQSILEAEKVHEPVLKDNDPLFGVLSEDQVGIDPSTARTRINSEVLHEMRTYLLAAEEPERKVREERVKKFILDLKGDRRSQNMILRLEVPPQVTTDIDKVKGPIFQNREDGNDGKRELSEHSGGKLIGAVINAGLAVRRMQSIECIASERAAANYESEGSVFRSVSMGFEIGSSEASSSGMKVIAIKHRRKLTPTKRKCKRSSRGKVAGKGVAAEGITVGVSPQKKKAEEGKIESTKIARRTKNEVVPHEGLPESQ